MRFHAPTDVCTGSPLPPLLHHHHTYNTTVGEILDAIVAAVSIPSSRQPGPMCYLYPRCAACQCLIHFCMYMYVCVVGRTVQTPEAIPRFFLFLDFLFIFTAFAVAFSTFNYDL